jgi:hypothetical protein
MSDLSGRNKFQNKSAETKPENYKTDGREKLINLPEISREKRISGLQGARRVNCVSTIKHRFCWLQQVLVRSLGIQFRRVRTHDQ